MIKRFILFGLGVFLGIIILSVGPENRLKKVFYEYVDYFSPNKRVLSKLSKSTSLTFTNKAECQLVYFNLNKEDIISTINDGEINFERSKKDFSEPCKYYILENSIDNKNISIEFEYCDSKDKVRVMYFVLDGEVSCDF